MSKLTLLLAATGVYLTLCLVIGVYANRSSKKEKATDYFLAGGGLGPIVLSLTMMATVFSAWFILGHQGSLWDQGFKYVAHFFHIPLMGMMSVLLFPRLWAVARKGNFVTMSEMYGTYYKSELIRILIVITGILYAVPYVALQLRGAGYVFNTLSSGQINAGTGSIVLGVVVVMYVFLGGLKATALTDTVQGILLVVAASLLGLTVIGAIINVNPDMSFFQQFKAGIESTGPEFITLNPLGQMYSWPYILTAGIVISGIYISPPYLMIIASAKSPKIFKFQGFVIMTLIMGFMYFVFSVLTGAGGRSIFSELAMVDALSLDIILNYMGPVAFLITALGIVAAMNSTAAGYLANTSTILARDLYLRYMNKNATGKQQVFVSRIMIVLIVLASIAFSLLVLDYLTILGTLATAIGIQLLPAMIGVTYMPKITSKGVNAGIVLGLLAVIFTYFVVRYPLGIHMGGWGLIVNCTTVTIVSYFTQTSKPDLNVSHVMFDKKIAANESLSSQGITLTTN